MTKDRGDSLQRAGASACTDFEGSRLQHGCARRFALGAWLGDGLMKTTKTITETKEVHVCDFCANSEHMACNPATCVVCGKEACCDCTHKRLVGMEVKRPRYWSTSGSSPHPETLWACPDCNDDLTRKIVALNKKVELAGKYMSDFVRSYCNTLDAIMREANRREKRSEASGKSPNGEVSEVAGDDSTKTSGDRPPLSLD